MSPGLCLGTAQFGLAYGITNTVGQVSEEAVHALLCQACQADVRWLDRLGLWQFRVGAWPPASYNT